MILFCIYTFCAFTKTWLCLLNIDIFTILFLLWTLSVPLRRLKFNMLTSRFFWNPLPRLYFAMTKLIYLYRGSFLCLYKNWTSPKTYFFRYYHRDSFLCLYKDLTLLGSNKGILTQCFIHYNYFASVRRPWLHIIISSN